MICYSSFGGIQLFLFSAYWEDSSVFPLPSLSLSSTTTSLLIICGIILQEVWTREVGERVLVSWWMKKKKESSMLGTDPYSWIHCHSIPNWRRTCMHTAGKRIWHSKIGSGMLLVNFRTLMLLEHPQTYAHTSARTIHKNPRKHTHTHTRTPEQRIPC